MVQDITLEQYIKLGGNLNNIDWNDAYSCYNDDNIGKKILSYEDKGEKGGRGVPLFYFTFEDGTVHRYAILFIKIKVDLVLAKRYR